MMRENGNIASIQFLRAFAAVLVVVMHSFFFLDGYTQSAGLTMPAIEGWYHLKIVGGIGVHIFFVISGFIMVHLLDTDPDLTTSKFFSRRLSRVVPLFWVVTAFWLWQSSNQPFWFIIKSFLFIPVKDVFPLTGVGWTLDYEMFFYAVFGLIAVAWGRSIMWVAVALAAISITSMITDNYVLQFYGNPITSEFVAGMVIYRVYRYPMILVLSPLILAAGLAGLVIAALTFAAPSEWATTTIAHWGPVAALLVLGCVSIEASGKLHRVFSRRLLQAIGASSYSLYLVHNIFFAKFGFGILSRAHLWPSADLMLLISCACGFGWFTYQILELPMHRALQKLIRARRGPIVTRPAAEAPFAP